MTYLAAPYAIDTGSIVKYACMAGQDDPLSPLFLAAGGPVRASLSISGHVYDAAGAAVVGATVVLFRQLDNFMCKTTTSGAAGVYSFTRRADDTRSYYVIAYTISGGSTQVHGVTNRGLVPV